jgi:aminoglycoside phosphotransferase (APT) family kinase protein
MQQPVGLAEAAGFLAERYAGQARDVAELGGGDWSRAFSFRLDGRGLVARFGRHGEDFARDQQAMALSGPDLPVPDLLETGRALGGAYAVSERRFGVFLESLDAARWHRVLPALLRALDALRDAPALDAGERAVAGPRGAVGGWREQLMAELEDRPGQRVSGWRAALARSAELDSLFVAGQRAVSGLLDACPEIRHVLHRDLLNRNVLVTGDGSRLTAVFDWGCYGLGDFLYEVAWFTFWAPWHAGLAAAGFRQAVLRHYQAAGLAVPRFGERLRCYELHVGLTHLAYCTFTGDPGRDLPSIARRTREILGSG